MEQLKGYMRNTLALILASSCLALAGCDVDQTQEGEMPDVDVNASAGEMPQFNVEGPDVDVGTENRVVETPTVDVDVPAENDQ